jgi:queuine/archaeosine tRNA-ribosyltransferase
MELVSDDWFGWAVGVSPVNDPAAVLRLIRYLESFENERPVHFFESGDAVAFLLIARYANKRGLFVTVDSTYASTAAQSGMLYMTVFGKLVTIGPKQETSFKSRLECMCPVCTKHGPSSVREEPELLTLHNTYMLVWRYKFLDAISTEKPEVLKQLLPEAVPYIRQLDAILEGRGGLLDYT